MGSEVSVCNRLIVIKKIIMTLVVISILNKLIYLYFN